MAWQHGVTGWVRNLDDGRVEAVFEGPASGVQHLVDWARHGPRLAVVSDATVHAEPPEGLGTFMIR
jgi:acylphosphatase